MIAAVHRKAKYFLATPLRIYASHKCVATPGLRTAARGITDFGVLDYLTIDSKYDFKLSGNELQ